MIVPTRVPSSSSTIIDHILASFPERVTQSGVIDICLSDHQLTYCTRKTFRIKRGSHKHIKSRLFNYHTVDLFKLELSGLNFSIYQYYNDINQAYNGFIQKIISVIDKASPIKKKGKTKLSGIV